MPSGLLTPSILSLTVSGHRLVVCLVTGCIEHDMRLAHNLTLSESMDFYFFGKDLHA